MSLIDRVFFKKKFLSWTLFRIGACCLFLYLWLNKWILLCMFTSYIILVLIELQFFFMLVSIYESQYLEPHYRFNGNESFLFELFNSRQPLNGLMRSHLNGWWEAQNWNSCAIEVCSIMQNYCRNTVHHCLSTIYWVLHRSCIFHSFRIAKQRRFFYCWVMIPDILF